MKPYGAECVMPIDFTDQEKAALIDLLVGAVEQNPSPQSQRIQLLRGVLAITSSASCRAS